MYYEHGFALDLLPVMLQCADCCLRLVHLGSCTAKMGPSSDPMAVVDQYGKVYGAEGLRVADASIMPECVRANINVTVLMIGERVAYLVKQGR